MSRPPKSLLHKWNKILKEAGFKDIEDEHGNLKEFHSKRFISDPDKWLSRQRYFELAGQLYHSHRFSSSLEKTVWGMHAEGIGTEEISRRVGKNSETVSQMLGELRRLITTE